MGTSTTQALDGQYCCLLMQEHQEDYASDILAHVTYATIFQDEKAQTAISLASLGERHFSPTRQRTECVTPPAVSVRYGEHETVVELVRGLIRRQQFSLEALQFLMASLGSGIKAADAFSNLNLQKFLLRELKLWNASATTDDLKWSSKSRRWLLPRRDGSQVEDDGSVQPIPKPQKISPVAHALYGELLLTAKSYQSSICTS